MSVSLGVNGSNYDYPETGELSWGPNATNFASAVSAALTKLGLGGTLTTDAVIDITSTTKGVRIPSMTTTQRNAIATPLTGFIVYNTTTNRLNVYYSSAWHEITIAESIPDYALITNATNPYLQLNKTNATAREAKVQLTGDLFNITHAGVDSININTSGNLGIGTDNPDGGKLQIANTNAPWGFSMNSSEEGVVIFGDTDDSSTAAGTTLLSLRYSSNLSNEVLYVDGNGDVRNKNNSYGAISDISLKENIVDTSPKLDDLLKVRIRNFNLIGSSRKQIGVVAQELETVFPGLVDETTSEKKVTNEDGTISEIEETYKSVKYSVFVPILIKAMQELQTKIIELENRINTLEGN